jgi:hypothetical protein
VHDARQAIVALEPDPGHPVIRGDAFDLGLAVILADDEELVQEARRIGFFRFASRSAVRRAIVHTQVESLKRP